MADNVIVHGESSTTTATGDSGKFLAEVVKVISNALKVADYARKDGEDPNAWRTWGGPMCEVVEITGSTDAQAITGECWIYGLRVTAAGTSTTLDLHQGTSTSGVNLTPGIATGTFNVLGYEKQIGFGAGVHCPTGLYANWGGTGSPKVALFVVRAQPT